jgi:hypothetical protein
VRGLAASAEPSCHNLWALTRYPMKKLKLLKHHHKEGSTSQAVAVHGDLIGAKARLIMTNVAFSPSASAHSVNVCRAAGGGRVLRGEARPAGTSVSPF